MLVVCYFFASTLISGIFAQNQNSTVGTPESDDINITTTISEKLDDELLPDIVLHSEGVGFHGSPPPRNKNKFFHLTFLDKLAPSSWLRPLTDKFSKFSDFLHANKHPNYGGVHQWSPQFLWEKLHEKGPQLLTGPYNSIYGFTHFSQHHHQNDKDSLDFPFAYRKN